MPSGGLQREQVTGAKVAQACEFALRVRNQLNVSAVPHYVQNLPPTQPKCTYSLQEPIDVYLTADQAHVRGANK